MSGVWSVEAVRYGQLPATKSALIHDFERYGEEDGPLALDYWFYVLRDGSQTVVVDTGFDSERALRRGRTVFIDPADVLAELDVDLLVLTHFHYDHIGNLDAIADAPIAAPAAELSFWGSATSRHASFWEHTDPKGIAAVMNAQRRGQVKPFAAACRLAPGLAVVPVGGHSPGQAVLLARTAEGPLLLCSDAVHLYDELQRRRPFSIFTDLPAMFEAYDYIDALAESTGATVIAGHDPLDAGRFALAGHDRHTYRLSPAALTPQPCS
jgi:glyoxylase-like metal-dependent hydrolase (beta-lactamase superfamily II)